MENIDVIPLRKLLIVDDEEEIGLMLKRMLKKKFKAIQHALTLQKGLEAAVTFEPHIILLDNNLPDGSGIDHIAQFKSLYPASCIIIVSAMTHLRSTALHNGAFAFIDKPLSLQKIVETIDKV